MSQAPEGQQAPSVASLALEAQGRGRPIASDRAVSFYLFGASPRRRHATSRVSSRSSERASIPAGKAADRGGYSVGIDPKLLVGDHQSFIESNTRHRSVRRRCPHCRGALRSLDLAHDEAHGVETAAAEEQRSRSGVDRRSVDSRGIQAPSSRSVPDDVQEDESIVGRALRLIISSVH